MLPMIAGYVLGTRASARAGGMSVVANAMSSGGGSTAALSEIDERFDRLLLVLEAMWSLLKDAGFNDEHLAARIAELDRADGAADGRRMAAPITCKSCGSKVAAGLPRCQICGTDTGVVPGPLDRI